MPSTPRIHLVWDPDFQPSLVQDWDLTVHSVHSLALVQEQVPGQVCPACTVVHRQCTDQHPPLIRIMDLLHMGLPVRTPPARIRRRSRLSRTTLHHWEHRIP